MSAAPGEDRPVSSGAGPRNRERAARGALFSPGYRGRLVWSILAGVVIGVVVWFSGMDLPHAAGLGAVVAAGGVCLAMLGERPSVQWPADPVAPREGARRDVAQLGWAVQTRSGTVTPEAVRHLRSVAAQTLALHGIELDEPAHRPAVERVLGADVVAIVRRGSAEAPRTAVFEAVLTRLERIAEEPAGRLRENEAPPTTATTVSTAARATRGERR
ncbi:MAG TPA: hypothetical protein VIG28_06765 [Leifsonia sp.]